MSGARRLQVWERRSDGTVELVRSAPAEGISLGRLLGFTDEDTVAVVGLALETGGIQRLFKVAVDGSGTAVEVGQLPAPGDNWVGAETLEVAAAALDGGTTRFAEPRWPWSDAAKLVSSLVLALFALGMFLTRRPRSKPAKIK
jgi:hypothetical protein